MRVSLFITLLLFLLLLSVESQTNYSYPCNVPGCSFCSHPDFCGQCYSNYFMNVNQTTGYTYCQQIICNISNCAQCDPNSNCQQCSAGYYLTVQGQCEQGSSTVTCGSYCLACSSDTTCSICEYGYIIVNNLCVPKIPNQQYGCIVYSTPSICQVCSSNNFITISYSCDYQQQFLQNFTCSIPNCFLCSNGTNCSVCQSGYLLQNGSCTLINCSVPNCMSCPNSPSVCSTCMPGFNSMNNQCVFGSTGCSVENCKYCSSITSCQICQNGYVLTENSLCVAATNQSCLYEGPLSEQMIGLNSYYTQGCIECASNYLNVFGSCMPKLATILCNVPNCQYCVADNYCGMCNEGYWLAQGSNTQCMVYIKPWNNCQQIQYNYYNDYQPIACNRCKNGYKNFQNYCIPLADIPLCNIIGCQLCYYSNQCAECLEGYTLNSQSQCIAQNNPQNCLEWESSESCNQCLPGFQENNQGLCISEQTEMTGSDCQTRYFSNCQSCNYVECLSCSQGYTLASYSSFCCQNQQENIYGCSTYQYNYYSYSQPSCQVYCSQFQPGFIQIGGGSYSLTCTIPNCNYCLKSSQCLVCSGGYNLNSQGKCVAYQQPSCNIFSCMTCNNTGQCTQCITGYQLFEGICVCDFQNCQRCLGGVFCTMCANQMVPNFVLNNGGCSPPVYPFMQCNVQNCFFCTSSDFCSVCDVGYTLSNGTCTRLACSASSNCQICFGNQKFCWLCKSGYTQQSLLDPQCASISSNYSCEVEYCSYCSSSLVCASCIEMYALTSSGQCVEAQCNSNCYVCLFNNTCLVCQPGYLLISSGACQFQSQQTAIPPCDSIMNCKICSYRQGAITRLGCDVCVPGFEPSINGYSCDLQVCGVKNCQFCVPTESLLCAICQQGYFLDSYFQCQSYTPSINSVACSVKNCLTCSSNNYCSSCLPGWNPIEGVCSNHHLCSISNCLFCISTNSCLACTANYCLSGAGEGNKCVSCDEPQPEPQPSSSNNLGLILGICIPLAVIIIILLAYLIYLRSRSNKQFLLYPKIENSGIETAKQNLELGGVENT